MPANCIARLLVTCKAFRRAGEKVLYEEIDLSNCPVRSLLLCKTLINSPYLSGLVRSFQIADGPNKLGRATLLKNRLLRIETPSKYHRQRDYSSVAGYATLNIKNVDMVALKNLPPAFKERFTRVRRLRVVRQYARPNGGELVNELPDVTHLEMPFTFGIFDGQGSYEIRASHSPNLEELIAPSPVAYQLVPGRPIRTLFILFPYMYQAPDPVQLASILGQSTTKITKFGVLLNFSWQAVATELLNEMADTLHDIEELRLRCQFWSFQWSEIEIDAFLQAASWSILLQSLPVLNRFSVAI